MDSLKTLLVANRGEIAARVLKTARYSSLMFSSSTLLILANTGEGNSTSELLHSTLNLTLLRPMSMKQTRQSFYLGTRQPRILMGS